MTRRSAVGALAGLFGLGAMASGLAATVPESLRAIAALILLLVLPAALWARPLAGSRGPVPLRASLGFLAWLCVLALWTAIFTVAGASFRVYAVASTWLLMGVFGVAAARSLRGAVPAPAAGRAWWIVAAAGFLFAASLVPAPGIGEDALDHIGYIRHIVTEDRLRPDGVLAAPALQDARVHSDPRKGALHGILALACWIAAADPLVVWRWVPSLMFPAAVLAVLALNGAFVASRGGRAAAAALVLLAFDGNPLRFAGASAHGESVAAMWCFALTAAAVGGPARLPWWRWAMLAAGGALIHLGVAMHVLVLVATMACLGGAWGSARHERVRACLALLAGAALALALRHDDLGGEVNAIHSHTQGVMFLDERWFVASPMEILRLHGMLFLGGLACIPALLFASRTRSDARAILVASAIPFAVSFVPWLATPLYAHGSYMVFRSLLQAPAFAAIVVCAGWLVRALRRRDRRAWLMGAPAAALWLIVFFRPVPLALAHDVRARTRAAPGAGARAAPAWVDAVASLPAGSVVLSDPATSYVLSAYTSHRVVAVYDQHGNPRDPFALDRIRAVRDVLSPFVLPDDAVAACRRYGVDYVVVNGSPPRDASSFLSIWRPETYPVALRRMATMAGSFALVDSAGGASVYRFDEGAPVNHAWSTQNQPVVVGAPPLTPCALDASGDMFRVTGVSVQPPRALPGDTLRFTLGYERDHPTPFHFPVVVHARFDHAIVGAGAEFPGEKQWRRFRDGREAVRSRFREDLVPGHGVYEPDLWPVGFQLCETFDVVVPPAARHGVYRVEISLEETSQVPNFHVRDLFYNHDHYSGIRCASVEIVDRTLGGRP